MNTDIRIGDIVKHFKWEMLSDEEKKQNKYIYQIKAIATHTEDGCLLVIYQALYFPFEIYARPINLFCEEVDHIKYPDIRQKYRFEKFIL